MHLQTLEAGSRQDNGIKLPGIQFAQPGLHIAAQAFYHQIRTIGLHLGLTAQAGRADAGPLGQRRQTVVMIGDEGIAGIFPLADHRQRKAFRQFHGHILHGMHGNIRTTVHDGLFQLLHEQALATDFCQRGIKNLVPLGLDSHQLHTQAFVQTFQTLLNVFRLPDGKRAGTGGDTQDFAGHGGSCDSEMRRTVYRKRRSYRRSHGEPACDLDGSLRSVRHGEHGSYKFKGRNQLP